MLKPLVLSGTILAMLVTAAPSLSAITASSDVFRSAGSRGAASQSEVVQLATWSAGNDVDGPYITDGTTKIKMKSDRTAKKTAKKFNKMESDGFKADPEGECADPRSGVLC